MSASNGSRNSSWKAGAIQVGETVQDERVHADPDDALRRSG